MIISHVSERERVLMWKPFTKCASISLTLYSLSLSLFELFLRERESVFMSEDLTKSKSIWFALSPSHALSLLTDFVISHVNIYIVTLYICTCDMTKSVCKYVIMYVYVHVHTLTQILCKYFYTHTHAFAYVQ